MDHELSNVEELIEDMKQNRGEMYDMLDDIKSFRKTLHILLPDKVDFKNRFILENKMKVLSSVLDTELSIRKQIDSSIKDEIGLRSKHLEEDASTDDRAAVRAIVEALEGGNFKISSRGKKPKPGEEG
jgi:hypothetical protein